MTLKSKVSYDTYWPKCYTCQICVIYENLEYQFNLVSFIFVMLIDIEIIDSISVKTDGFWINVIFCEKTLVTY